MLFRLVPIYLILCLSSNAMSAPPLPEHASSFLQNHCIDCHDGPDGEGGFDLSSLTQDLENSASLAKWSRVIDRITSEEMPPADADQPKPAEAQNFAQTTADWITDFQKASSRKLDASALDV